MSVCVSVVVSQCCVSIVVADQSSLSSHYFSSVLGVCLCFDFDSLPWLCWT